MANSAIFHIGCFLLALALLLFAAQPALAQTDKEHEVLLEKAESGNVEAQLELADIYDAGREYSTALSWFRKAADNGDAYARLLLGKHYAEGKGIEKNTDEALEWYRKSADQGYVLAQFYLGEAYVEKQNYQEAYFWYRRAAAVIDVYENFVKFSKAKLSTEEIDAIDQRIDDLPKQSVEYPSSSNFDEIVYAESPAFGHPDGSQFTIRDGAIYNKSGGLIRHLSRWEVSDLVDALNDTTFMWLPYGWGCGVTDTTWVTITVKIDGRRNFISHNTACPAPSKIQEAERVISAVILSPKGSADIFAGDLFKEYGSFLIVTFVCFLLLASIIFVSGRKDKSG